MQQLLASLALMISGTEPNLPLNAWEDHGQVELQVRGENTDKPRYSLEISRFYSGYWWNGELILFDDVRWAEFEVKADNAWQALFRIMIQN